MKRIRVTVTEEYLIPDDWEILTHPTDLVACLHGDQQFFMPDLEWAQRRLSPTGGSPQAAPRADWVSVDDDRGNWFIGQLESQDARIDELK